VVYVTLDPKQGRIVGTTRLDQYIDRTPHDFKLYDEVSLLIARTTDIGYLAIINHAHQGLLYASEVFEPLKAGDVRKGYIKNIREDGKIDLSLHKFGYEKVEDATDKILTALKARAGFIPVTDKSTPEAIYDLFGMSKKTYKKSVGALFKQRLISIDPDGIRAAKKAD
jgi:hypothetical protein